MGESRHFYNAAVRISFISCTPRRGGGKNMSTMRVTVPAGVVPGMQLQVQTPAGLMQVPVPAGAFPGVAFDIVLPATARPKRKISMPVDISSLLRELGECDPSEPSAAKKKRAKKLAELRSVLQAHPTTLKERGVQGRALLHIEIAKGPTRSVDAIELLLELWPGAAMTKDTDGSTPLCTEMGTKSSLSSKAPSVARCLGLSKLRVRRVQFPLSGSGGGSDYSEQGVSTSDDVAIHFGGCRTGDASLMADDVCGTLAGFYVSRPIDLSVTSCDCGPARRRLTPSAIRLPSLTPVISSRSPFLAPS